VRIVFDTNVVVSACFWSGAPLDCLKAWLESQCTAFISPPLLAEYEEVYAELALDYPDRQPVNWVGALRDSAEMVFPVDRVVGVVADPFDAMVLECATAAEAEFIISGDKKHLLPLGSYRGCLILSPGEFLKRLR
jgi:putative PIN family toxin of toxin-antitoxin system